MGFQFWFEPSKILKPLLFKSVNRENGGKTTLSSSLMATPEIMTEAEKKLVTPGEVLGMGSEYKAGKGAYVSPDKRTVYSALTGFISIVPAPADSLDKVFFHS